MRVLVCAEDIFSGVGGGQSFYADLVRRYPEHQFWYFASDPAAELNVPFNVHVVSALTLYRDRRDGLSTEGFAVGGHPIGGKKYDLLYMLDLAASVPDVHFDVVDIPDYMGYGAALPAALRQIGVRFDRVAVSLHGTLSDGVSDNWADIFSPPELVHLRAVEDMLYTGADVRYAISKRYLAEREADTGVRGEMLDLTHLIAWPAFQALREGSSLAAVKPIQQEEPPALAFVGRQEKWKGPDLFVDLVSGLPSSSFSAALLVGPETQLGGVRSGPELARMAANRSVVLDHRQYTREALWSALAESRWVVVIPSRRDTLNLAALESLLTGTPTIISKHAGVCDFLDETFPGLPFRRMDPADLTSAKPQLLEMLAHFDAERAALADYLDSHTPLPTGLSLEEIYGSTNQRAADDQMYRAFAPVLDHLARGAFATSRIHMREQLTSRLKDILGELPGREAETGDLVKFFSHAFDAICELRVYEIALRETSEAQGFLSDEQMEAVWAYLEPFCYSVNRVAVYKLLADLEKQRGNLLLYATYHVRCMRLSGRSQPDVLREVMGILRDQGFPEEADAVSWMHGDAPDYGAARAYLDAMPKRFSSPPVGDIELELDERTISQPKISVIVSMYNAASKLPVFFNGLARFTEKTRAMMELVLVDSCSPDDTTTTVRKLIAKHRAAGWNLSVNYIRTSKRETIQRAWNRGIAAATGEYLSFLGVDEMNRPDAFDIMSEHLDRNANVDWVQGTALVTEVNEGGSFVRDLMLYDRRFDGDYMNLMDTCYVGYVGAVYRKSIHERVGYYDDRFRGAGDSEFKNRALPLISVITLPICLGFFLNYPEERTTQSPMAEIEDIRAWYLYRTSAGVGYVLGDRTDQELERVLRRCMGYRKSYLTSTSTDLELATSIVDYVDRANHDLQPRIFAQGSMIRSARDIYRALDCASEMLGRRRSVRFVHEASDVIERAAFSLASTARSLEFAGLPAPLDFNNDNRSQQHHYHWRSRSQKVLLGLASPPVELAGPQDFAELLSACQATDQNVDYERAYRGNDLKQLQRLYNERSLDIAVEWADDSRVDEVLAAYNASRVEELGQSLVVVGARSSNPDPGARVYLTGPVGRPGPALASAQGLVVWSDPKRPRLGLTRLLRAIVYGKLFVADRGSVEALAAEFPAVDLSAFKVAEDLVGAFVQLGALIDADDATEQREALARARTVLKDHPNLVTSLGPISLLPPTTKVAEVFQCNRELRDVYEQGGIELVQSHVSGVGEARRDLMRALGQALFNTKAAPILQTEQTVFVRIMAEPPITFPGVEAPGPEDASETAQLEAVE